MRLMTQTPGREVSFEVAAKRDSRVNIAGTFNGWDPKTHPLSYHPENDLFKAALYLPAGLHEYKFVIDGVWQMDAKCPYWALNNTGTLNSVVLV